MNQVRRRQLVIAAGALLAAPVLTARAQRGDRMRRVGVLMLTDMSPAFREAFLQGMRERGFAEGKDYEIDWRSAQGSAARADALAAELVSRRVDVIVATLSGAVRAASNATRTIPIVMAPSGADFVKNLARPEGNITGMGGIAAELPGKWIELLHEMIPGLKRVAVLLNGADMEFGKRMLTTAEAAARQRGLATSTIVITQPDEIEAVFAAAAKAGTAAAIVQPSVTIPRARAAQVAQLGLRYRVALMSASSEFTEAGGLASYGVDFIELYRYTASYVVKLLRGAKPGDLPVERADRTTLVLNAATAKALGVTIPSLLLMRANKVIE